MTAYGITAYEINMHIHIYMWCMVKLVWYCVFYGMVLVILL